MADWWRGAVIYQIYPRSFQDSDGDGIGDLPGITARLPLCRRASASTRSGCRRSSPRRWRTWATTCRTIPTSTRSSARSRTSTRWWREAHALGLKVIIDQVLSHTSTEHPWFEESRQDRTNPKADWYVWADPKPDGSPPNNWLSVFGGGAWAWEPRRRQYYLHNFLAEQPDLNFHNPEVLDGALDACASGSSAAWTASGSTPSTSTSTTSCCATTRPTSDARTKPEWNPYEMQDHHFSKTQPENLAFLERMRALPDEYEARTMVGEVGEATAPIGIMGDYTSRQALHMPTPSSSSATDFTAEHFRARIEEFFAGAPDGWPCWAFSNHDVMRHVTRWAKHGVGREPLAKLAGALLLSLEGSICIYQGEELGQTETDIEFDELTDPQGMRFWPENKGRDGCRTPMVWDARQRQRAASPPARPGCRSRRRRRRTTSPGRSAGRTRCWTSTARC